MFRELEFHGVIEQRVQKWLYLTFIGAIFLSLFPKADRKGSTPSNVITRSSRVILIISVGGNKI